MKKLAILIYSLGSGGAEKVVSLLLPELQRKFRVELFLMADIIHYDIPQDIQITFLEKSTPYENGLKKLLKIPLLAWKYQRLCKEKEIDISLSLMNRPNYINVLSKIFGKKSKTVISERAMPSLEYGKKDLKSVINKFLIKFFYPKADKIITNSNANSLDLVENFRIPEEQVERIYNPIDLDLIDLKKLEKIDFDFFKFTFISIGRLDNGKNHKMMIEGFSKIDNEEKQLIIIGSGQLEEKLKEYIDYLDLNDRVFLVGKQENPYTWLHHADCFLFTSKHEGFPNVILEALACQLPIISTDPNGVVSEIFQGKCGKVINSLEELISSMENIPKRDGLRERAEDFRKEKLFSKYYETLL